MSDSPDRLDPDALLAHLRESEERAKRGRLKVFLGMCPGVGKTYAMLREGQRERSEGRQVVVGLVETHGRAETQAMLEGLEVQPRRTLVHRGTTLREMDLETLLARRPQLVLVDELAHENAPGSRHPKRWQDVVELLDAGIDIFTTLNIQHVESRAEVVRQITSVQVSETVPDSVLDLTDEVELVDLTSQSLLERLRDGKVYLGERAVAAANHFFQESNLNALREIALRFTAERVDRQLRDMRRTTQKRTVWRSGERLLVAVGPSPFSTQLVRWTRRLAAAQGAPWVAVHVEGTAALKPEAQGLLDRNLALAKELGAELVLTQGEDVARTLVRVALQRNATQIVVGKPRRARWLDLLSGGNLVDRLIRLGGNIDIYVVPAEPSAKRQWIEFEPPAMSDLGEYCEAVGAVALVTAIGVVMPSEYYLATGMVYLLAVIGMSLRIGRGPVILAGVLSALAWNLFFIPPRFTFAVTKVEDAVLLVTYIAVALISGHLTARIRSQVLAERRREERATALFQFTRAITEAGTLDEAVFAALRQIDELYSARSTLLLVDSSSGEVVPHFAASFALDANEKSVAEWALRNLKPAGRYTETLPSREGLYLPLIREQRVVGVLGVVVPRRIAFTLAHRELLEALCRPLALVLEREQLRAAGERERLLAESERLHRALLDSVSHELRTPLAVITSAVDNLAEVTGEPARDGLIQEVRQASRRLNRLVSNLLDQTRLEGGTLHPRLDWCDPVDLVNSAIEATRDVLSAHQVEMAIEGELPPVKLDHSLTEQALTNLLVNAALHTPAGTKVFVTAGVDGGGTRAYFVVADNGPGFPAALRERLFEKFVRGDAARPGGLGLGLSIVRGFTRAQGGDVVIGANPGGGAVMTLYFPNAVTAPATTPLVS